VAQPEIPVEIRAALEDLRLLAAAAFQRQDWESAARRMNDTYEFLRKQQQRYQTRFHKGWELHNGGIALIRLGRAIEGIDRILMAYAEDALSAETGSEDAIDALPAGLSLRAWGVPEKHLAAMKKVAKRRKERGNVPLDPNELVVEALAEFKLDQELRAQIGEEARQEETVEKRRIESLTEPLELCCFVGGNYYTRQNLELIKQIVTDEGFKPIMPLDFEIPENDIHDRSLLLLHRCRKAVFEVSSPAGQLMELERCRDYNIRPLLLRQTSSGQKPEVSAMISSMADVEMKAYSMPDELRRLIHDYLHG
jgi:hypothetical protein